MPLPRSENFWSTRGGTFFGEEWSVRLVVRVTKKNCITASVKRPCRIPQNLQLRGKNQVYEVLHTRSQTSNVHDIHCTCASCSISISEYLPSSARPDFSIDFSELSSPFCRPDNFQSASKMISEDTSQNDTFSPLTGWIRPSDAHRSKSSIISNVPWPWRITGFSLTSGCSRKAT